MAASRHGVVLALLLLVVGLCVPVSQEAHAQLPGGRNEATQEGPGLISRALFQVRQAQGKLQRQLAAIVKDIKRGGGYEPVLLLIAMSFLYGVFHAAGPGHGKVVISSYLLTHDSRIRNGVLISFAAALVQALSALLLVGSLALLLALPRLQVTGHVRTLELVSYGLIVALGLWMLYGTVTGRGCGHADHDRHGGDHPGHDHEPGGGSGGGLARRIGRIPGLVLAVGIRPCSGAVIVLLFTLANDLLPIGVAATFAMALGTGLTVSALGIMSVFGNKLTRLIGTRSGRWEQRLRSGLAIAGSLFITAVGAALFLLTYGAPSGPLL